MTTVERLRMQLENPSTSISQKHRILFALKNADSPEAHAVMMLGLNDASALFRHEVAYCLGQTQKPEGIEELIRTLLNQQEHPMVRHEAGEALGAIGSPSCIPPLEQHAGDAQPEVRETCLLALRRIEHLRNDDGVRSSRFVSVDPTPASNEEKGVMDLENQLMDEKEEMFDRYRALFALRNIGGAEAVESIVKALDCDSALLKHEVAFVLGQMQQPLAVEALRRVLQDRNENPMVRHEAAEALGSIADESCIAALRQYSRDPEPIVAESCLVALDVLDHERSDEFEYVAIG